MILVSSYLSDTNSAETDRRRATLPRYGSHLSIGSNLHIPS